VFTIRKWCSQEEYKPRLFGLPEIPLLYVGLLDGASSKKDEKDAIRYTKQPWIYSQGCLVYPKSSKSKPFLARIGKS
jgi:hypothetical protein